MQSALTSWEGGDGSEDTKRDRQPAKHEDIQPTNPHHQRAGIALTQHESQHGAPGEATAHDPHADLRLMDAATITPTATTHDASSGSNAAAPRWLSGHRG